MTDRSALDEWGKVAVAAQETFGLSWPEAKQIGRDWREAGRTAVGARLSIEAGCRRPGWAGEIR